MCLSGIMYQDESQEENDNDFYNKVDSNWDYYSGLPSPKAYEKM